MTQAKAATVAAALINAGFACQAILKSNGTWIIRSQASGFTVPVGTVATFVTNQGIAGNIADVEYS